jgi:hypothetical protein
VRSGLLALLAGTVVLLGALDKDAGAEIVFVPMLLIGLGIGALASQLGAVTVSAVPDDESPEVGGLQNTMTNLGASLGTALAGSLLIATLITAFLTNIEQSSTIPRVKSRPRSNWWAECPSSPTPTRRGDRHSDHPHPTSQRRCVRHCMSHPGAMPRRCPGVRIPDIHGAEHRLSHRRS